MSIYETGNKIKRFLDKIANSLSNEIFVISMIILIGFAGFGLGRLSILEGQKLPISVENIKNDKMLADVSSSVKNIIDENQNSGGLVVASKNGTKYHYPWCSGAKRINEANKIYFSSIEEAKKAGYTPASNCKGLK
ncbi:hypothetical protein KJ991_00445 [Patescibacteria group bacterium]|nr:hypothetical protein [Patescibacteria group bacterium]MBU4115996.1 hypothetical protein [Patescibacteria group bacterium]